MKKFTSVLLVGLCLFATLASAQTRVRYINGPGDQGQMQYYDEGSGINILTFTANGVTITNIATGGSGTIDWDTIENQGVVSNNNLASAAAVAWSKLSNQGVISNSNVGASAAIAWSKLNNQAVISNENFAAGAIDNADISASAAIAWSKVSNQAVISNENFAAGCIDNADVAAGAAIAWSKLSNQAVVSNNNMAADAVTGSTIADGSISNSEIASAERLTNQLANLLWDVSLVSAESASPSNATITIQCRNPWGTSIAAAKTVQFWFTTPTVQTVPSQIGMNTWSFDAHGTVKSYWDLGTVQSNYIYTVESHTDGTIDIIAQADAANWTNYVYVLANGSVTSCAVVYKE